jgi:ABC-type methionine transport system permease subunit
MEELGTEASILRLAYMAENESKRLVEKRLKAMKRMIAEQWAEMGNPYELIIETEVFWRTGAPPERSSK